jgi:hypothetical protein
MLEKLSATAKNCDVIAKIVSNVLGVCVWVCLAFAVLVLIFGEKMFDVASLTLDLDFVKLHLNDQYKVATDGMKLYTSLGLVSAAVSFGIISWSVRLLRRILAPMMNGRPFDAVVPGTLKNAAWVVLGGGIIIQILGIVERFIATKAYPMDLVFASDTIDKWEFAFTMDYTFVLVFFVLMLLSYVFSYGVQLQKESDETL